MLKYENISAVAIQIKQKWLSYIAGLAALKERIISHQTYFPDRQIVPGYVL
jgi:hypothetical protein